MMDILNKMGRFVALFNSEASVSQYVSNGASVIGSGSFFSKLPSLNDVSSHLHLIETLLYNEEVPLSQA